MIEPESYTGRADDGRSITHGHTPDSGRETVTIKGTELHSLAIFTQLPKVGTRPTSFFIGTDPVAYFLEKYGVELNSVSF